MKFGLRTPSLKKRISARTSLKRYARHSLGLKAPRGFGIFTNPKKAIYNWVYNRTSVSIDRLANSSSVNDKAIILFLVGLILTLSCVGAVVGIPLLIYGFTKFSTEPNDLSKNENEKKVANSKPVPPQITSYIMSATSSIQTTPSSDEGSFYEKWYEIAERLGYDNDTRDREGEKLRDPIQFTKVVFKTSFGIERHIPDKVYRECLNAIRSDDDLLKYCIDWSSRIYSRGTHLDMARPKKTEQFYAIENIIKRVL